MANPNKFDSQLADNSGNPLLGSQQSQVSDASSSASAVTSTINTGVVRDVTTVDASGGGTGSTTNCTNVPSRSIILNVEANCTTAFDGTSTTTFEVGVSGNADAYIDTVDFDPTDDTSNFVGSASGTNNDEKGVQYVGSATQIIATWTNSGGTPGAGEVDVTVHYIPVNNTDIDDIDSFSSDVATDLSNHDTDINAVLDVLESHGLMSDS